MNKDYSINFKIGAETKALDNLGNKATQTEHKFFGLSSSVEMLGRHLKYVASYSAAFAGFKGSIEYAKQYYNQYKETRNSQIDMETHWWFNARPDRLLKSKLRMRSLLMNITKQMLP